MKRTLFLIFAVLLCLPVMAGGATYYVDKRCSNNGDGSAATCAASPGGVGAFNLLSDVSNAGKVANGTHTIEIVAGSGPYNSDDCTRLSLGYFYPGQQNSSITYNFNGNTLQTDIDVNDGTYDWTVSTAVGKTDWYYLQASGGGDPGIVDPESVIVGEDWNVESSNLINTPSGDNNNWAWGDYDSLGYNTLYVRYGNPGTDPTSSGIEIWACQKQYVIRWGYTTLTAIINDATLRGAYDFIVMVTGPATFNRCTFKNTDGQAISINNAAATPININNSLFVDSGHRSIDIATGPTSGAVNVYNSIFAGSHLAMKLTSNAVYTVTFKNNLTYNLYAGAIQHDNANPTFTESNNLFFIDGDSPHGGRAIAFTGATPQWTTTDSKSIPASFDATTACSDVGDPGCGTDPVVDSNYQLNGNSPAINAGSKAGDVGFNSTQTDFFGNTYFFTPYDRLNIGADQQYSDADLRPTGGGEIVRGNWTTK